MINTDDAQIHTDCLLCNHAAEILGQQINLAAAK